VEPLHLEGAVKLLMHASAVAHVKRISKPMCGNKDQVTHMERHVSIWIAVRSIWREARINVLW